MKINPITPVYAIQAIKRDKPSQHRMTLDVTSQEVINQQEAEEWIRFINETMAYVGAFVFVGLLLATFSLICYWVSPWAVVSIISLAGLIGAWTKAKGCW